MKKVAVQPSLQYNQVEPKDSIKKQRLVFKKKKKKRIMKSWWKKALIENLKNWHSEEKWALQVKSHCQRLTHTSVVSVNFTR